MNHLKMLLCAVVVFTSANAWSYPFCGDGAEGSGSQGTPCVIRKADMIACGGGVFVCSNAQCPVTVESSVLGGTYQADGSPIGQPAVDIGVDVCSSVSAKVVIKRQQQKPLRKSAAVAN